MTTRQFKALHPAKDTPTKHEVVEIQRRIEQSVNGIAGKHIVDGNLLADANGSPLTIALTAGIINLVEHGLGRPANGFLVVYSDAPVMAWAVSTTADLSQYLPLGCTADANVRLLVF